MAVADVFDALTHERVYRKAWPIDQVRDCLRDVAGQHLDPYYVDILIRNLDKAAGINERWPD